MSEVKKGDATRPPNYDRPSPLPKLPDDAPAGAEYRLGNGIYVDGIGQEVKPVAKPAPPQPNPAPAPAPQPNPFPAPSPQPVPQGK